MGIIWVTWWYNYKILYFSPFLGLNLLDVIEDLRNEDDEDLIIQCNVFDDEKQEDDEDLALLNPAGVDISNPQEVFNALYQKVKYCNLQMN